MTTSGTSDFNPQILPIINMAFRKIGAIQEDETASDAMYEDALFSLNGIIKTWEALGIHVWTEEEAILFTQPGQVRYLLGGATTDNCTDANSYVQPQLNAPASTGDLTVTLDSVAGIANGNFFGVTLDDGPIYWTTVNGAPVGNVVTLAAAMPANAGAQNFAFAYATKIVRPLKVPSTRLFQYNGRIETPMTRLSRKEYMDLPQKFSPGTATQFFYSPKRDQGELYLWPAPSSSTFGARFTWYRPIQDVTDASQTTDFPQEWVNPLGWNLAREIGPEYDCPPARWAIVKSQADEQLDLVQSWDRESEPVYFSMGYDEAER